MKSAALVITLCLSLSACSAMEDFNLNPMNWIGGSSSDNY